MITANTLTGMGGILIQQGRYVSAAGNSNAWLLAAAIANGSSGCWRENFKIMGCGADSTWGDIGII